MYKTYILFGFFNSGSVEVILSKEPGVGKTLQVHRRTDALRDKLTKSNKDILDPLCVTVPLHEAYVKVDDVVAMLLPHQLSSYIAPPRIFHIDVAPMVGY